MGTTAQVFPYVYVFGCEAGLPSPDRDTFVIVAAKRQLDLTHLQRTSPYWSAPPFASLETAWQEASQPHQREHVMPFFYDYLDRFKVLLVHYPQDFGTLRWTVDTPEDLEFMRQVYNRFNGRDDFSWKEVLDLVNNEPALMEINAGIEHKTLKDIDKRALKR